MDAIRVKEGVTITLPNNTFTNRVRFAGWNAKADGTGVTYADGSEITITSDLTLYAQWEGFAGGHEWVDLGLPSGTKWATCNVGANSPEEFGNYFAWGETEPKSDYSWNTYKWSSGNSSKMTKYCTSSSYGTVDNKTKLDLEDDAAYVNWGEKWRMPTKEEQDELISKCSRSSDEINGVEGFTLTGPNGKTIFLPAAGYCQGSNIGILSSGSVIGAYGHQAFYMSNTVHSTNQEKASCLGYGTYVAGWFRSEYRYYGQSVRPVLRE